MRIALLIAVVALAGNALAAKPVKQGTVNAPTQSQPAPLQPSHYEQTAKAYAAWKEAVKSIEDPPAEMVAIYEAHWQRLFGIADRIDKKQLTDETGAKLNDISLKQANDEAQHLALVLDQAEEQKARTQAEAARVSAQAGLERAEREAKTAAWLAALPPEQRAAILSSISQCVGAGFQKNTPQFSECVLTAMRTKVQASAEDDARRAAALRFGLGMLGNSYLPPGMAAGRAASPGQFQDPPPIQVPSPPKMCTSYVNGQYITTRCW